MIEIDRERRAGQRISLERPCKVYEPHGRRYVSGRTCNVTPGGMLLSLDRAIDLEAGDRLYVGIAQRRRHALIHSDELIEARVVRVPARSEHGRAVAVRFVEPQQESFLPVRRAA